MRVVLCRAALAFVRQSEQNYTAFLAAFGFTPVTARFIVAQLLPGGGAEFEFIRKIPPRIGARIADDAWEAARVQAEELNPPWPLSLELPQPQRSRDG